MTILLRACLALMRLLPTPVAIGLGRGLGWLLGSGLRFRRPIVACQMQAALGGQYSAAELELLQRRFYRHLGLLAVELLRLPRVQPAKLLERAIFHDAERVDAARAAGKGVILISGHIGNWEYAVLALAARGYPVKVVGKEIKGQTGDLLKTMIRDDNGVVTLPRRDSARQILQALRRNEIVVLVIDQNMTDDEGIFADFFGYPACTMAAPVVFAERTGATLLPGFAVRDADFYHHHCHAWPAVALEHPHADATANLRHNVTRLNQTLEAIVRAHPDQWLWIHKRWKTRPAGEVSHPFIYVRHRPSPIAQATP